MKVGKKKPFSDGWTMKDVTISPMLWEMLRMFFSLKGKTSDGNSDLRGQRESSGNSKCIGQYKTLFPSPLNHWKATDNLKLYSAVLFTDSK